MIRSVAATVLALAVLGGPASADGTRRATSCFEAKGRTVAADRTHRVFTTGATARAKLYACREGSRPRLLAEAYDDGDTSSGRFISTQLRGHYVAYVYVRVDVSCKAACPEDFETMTETLRLLDLSSGRKVTIGGFSGRSFGLTNAGAVAWISPETNGQRSVLAHVGGDQRTVARATGIEAGSLEASASRITWLQDGRIAAATLR